jgi:hypothetical protein
MTANDVREQLANQRQTGTFAEVQLPQARITALHGILLDFDPGLYEHGNPLFPPAADPRAFFEQIAPVLDRHPLARHAEVRVSGSGLHVIVRLGPPVELATDADQRRWAALVKAVQCSLPADPGAPGITALTRPVGSVNSKNGAVVELLRAGKPVEPGEVEAFVARLGEAPFREVVTVLCGGDRVTPCPACRAEGSRLDVLDRVGLCYSCGEVKLAQVLDGVFAAPRPQQAGGTQPAPGPSAKDKPGKVASKARKAPGRAARKAKGD